MPGYPCCCNQGGPVDCTSTVDGNPLNDDWDGDTIPNFLDIDDQFGSGVAPLSDLDGDGIADLAVNAPTDDDVIEETQNEEITDAPRPS